MEPLDTNLLWQVPLFFCYVGGLFVLVFLGVMALDTPELRIAKAIPKEKQ
tara:strand:- start:355 stop:504 length:150 start_codon:yes stop_codon:yes gene_type:complete